VRPAPRAAPKIAAQPASEERVARARRIWDESRPVLHTVATAYLRRRAIPDDLWDTPALRFHPSMTSLDDRAKRTALIAAISDAQGALQGVQVTLLTAHGTAKATVATPRRVIGKLMGGAVRLGEAGDEFAVGEGVETMLSVSTALHTPSWAALTAGNLALFEPPPGIRRLIIAPDSDGAGMIAAGRLYEKLAATIGVDIARPPTGCNDWNDHLMQRSQQRGEDGVQAAAARSSLIPK
jgi:phage/plasmid primase-like uncharacterized protein